MIGKLHGNLDEVNDETLIIDVGGVGYLVHCGSRTLSNLPGLGDELVLFIETHVREDMFRLYGFQSPEERDWFRFLQSVQGVGARVALAILGTVSVGDLAKAVTFQDKSIVAQAQGVGPKLANRIVTELKDKPLPGGPGIAVKSRKKGASTAKDEQDGAPAQMDDALSALIKLGYRQADAARALQVAQQGAPAQSQVQDLIRSALKELSA